MELLIFILMVLFVPAIGWSVLMFKTMGELKEAIKDAKKPNLSIVGNLYPLSRNFQEENKMSKVKYPEGFDPFKFGIGAYFTEKRFNDDHHLGNGDIRLALAQQDEIIKYCKSLGEKEDRP